MYKLCPAQLGTPPNMPVAYLDPALLLEPLWHGPEVIHRQQMDVCQPSRLERGQVGQTRAELGWCDGSGSGGGCCLSSSECCIEGNILPPGCRGHGRVGDAACRLT